MREIKFNFFNTKTNKYTRWEESNAGMMMLAFYTHKHLMFLQYTGLKDKNGKEIFEGDVYDIGICTKVIRSTHFIEDTFELMKMLQDNAKVEVIGNIYENQELINS